MNDISGVHIRLARSCHALGLPDWIKDISGACIGEHQRGKDKNETPHFHCWLPKEYYRYDISGGIQSQARNWYNDRIPDLSGAWKGKGNGLWMWKLHDSFEKWVAYVFYNHAECKDPKVILWNRPDPPPVPRLIENLIIPALGVEGGRAHDGVPVPVCAVAPSRKNLTTQDKQAKFYRYVKEYVQENPDEVLCYSDITDLLYEYSTGGFNEMAAPQYVEYAMYWYLKDAGDKVRSLEVKESWRSRVLARLRK